MMNMMKDDEFLLWAHIYWTFIHVSAASATTPAMREAFKKMMSPDIMYHLIVCRHPCASNFLRHLKELPIEGYMISNKTLLEWTFELHNMVNDETGKARIHGEDLQNLRDYYLPSLQDSSTDSCSSCSDSTEPIYDQYRNGTYKVIPSADKVHIQPSFRRK